MGEPSCGFTKSLRCLFGGSRKERGTRLPVRVSAMPQAASPFPWFSIRAGAEDEHLGAERFSPRNRLPVADIEEKHVESLNRFHGPTGLLLHARTNLSGLRVASLSRGLALPERDSEGLPGLAVSENDVTDVARFVSNPWVNDIAHDPRNIGDSIRCRL
jgi:hypothetical protein